MRSAKLRAAAKTFLSALGTDPARVGELVRGSEVFRQIDAHNTRRLISQPERRRTYVLKMIREFNPGLSQRKAPGVVRLATIWEGVGRLAWLDHANQGLDCEIVHMPRAIVNPAWRYYLGDYLALVHTAPVGEYSLDRYYQPRFAAGRKRFYAYNVSILQEIRAAFDIDVLVMPKLNDDWTIDYINAAKSIGLPVLIDDREGAITPKRLEVVPPRLRDLMKVEFDVLCVHNEIHKELFVRAGLPSKKIVVNGAPQSDYWRRPDLWQSRKKIHAKLQNDRFLLLFFSFGPRTYLNFYYGEEKRDWTYLCADFHQVLLDLLKRHGDRIQIVNKSGGKPLRDLFPGRAAFMEEAAPYMNVHNYIELDGTYSAFDLLRNADCVLGFQTSGMIEAMFRDVPIVYGAWGPYFEEIKETLLPLHECKGVMHAASPLQLSEVLEQLITAGTQWTPNELEKSARRALRETYFARADGQVSRRLLEYAKALAPSTGPGVMKLAG